MVAPTFLLLSTFVVGAIVVPATAFQVPSSRVSSSRRYASALNKHHALELKSKHIDEDDDDMAVSRRSAITSIASLASTAALLPTNSAYAEEESIFAPKFVQTYEDFTSTSEGWSYKEVKIGKDIGGGDLKDGDRVVFDWSGYTIGYFGRPFEAKG